MVQAEKAYNVVNGTSYNQRTDTKVIRELENARISQTNVRVFYGDSTTGEVWPEEYDVHGHIGRSTGACKVPLLIKKSNSMGGGHMLDHCVLGILKRDTTGKLYWAYRHPKMNLGKWSYHSEDVQTGQMAEVRHNGQVHARFKNFKQAYRYYQFMTGKRLGR